MSALAKGRGGVRVVKRDRRFVAVHRGGPLERPDHVLLAQWAADVAEGVLPWFARISADDRPRAALETARAWAEGTIRTGVAMRAAVAAHAAARSVTDAAAIAAARATGHAVATAHAADHCMGALLYALRAWQAAGRTEAGELEGPLSRLPEPLRSMVRSGVEARMPGLGVGRDAGWRDVRR